MRLLRTGTCGDSVWTLLTEQGVRFPRNLCVPTTQFTWHPRWPYVRRSPVWNSQVSTIAFAAPVSSSDSDFNRGDRRQADGTFGMVPKLLTDARETSYMI